MVIIQLQYLSLREHICTFHCSIPKWHALNKHTCILHTLRTHIHACIYIYIYIGSTICIKVLAWYPNLFPYT